MLKILIIILLVFCVLLLYSKKTRKVVKKLMYVNILIFATFMIGTIENISIIQNNKFYLACSYDPLISQYESIAKKVASDNGISVALLFAQAITEQGLNFNKAKFLFGIKVSGAKDPSSCSSSSGNDSGVTWHGKWYGTQEEVNGKTISTGSCFRVYDSAEDSIIDYGYWLTHNFKYRDRLKQASTLEEQIAAINGYATSSSYCQSLVSNINSCNLAGSQLDATKICGNAIDPNNLFPQIIKKEHFATSYGGEIMQGWLYLRTKAYEDPRDEHYIGPDIMDDAIDEIFYRARLAYTANPFGNDDDPGDQGELSGDNEKLCEDMKTINAGGVNTWRQGGMPWSKISIGSSSSDTISKWGCFTVSLAIQIKRSGVDTGIDNFNPGTFACEMLKHGGFDSGANIYASKINFIPGVSSTLNESINATQNNTGNLINRLNELMSQGHYPILWVNGSGSSGHYVAVTGVTGSNVNIIDPSGRGTTLWPAYTKVSAIRSVKVN